MLVELPSSAQIDLSIRDGRALRDREGPTHDVRFERSDSFAGFMLTKESGSRPTIKAFAGQFALCGQKEACTGWPVFNWTDWGDEPNREQILPAGTYRLYIITGRSPVRIKLTLHGLEGTVVAEATTPASADFATMSQESILGFGDTPLMDVRSFGKGMSLDVAWAKGQNSGATLGVCRFKGDMAKRPMAAAGPTCGQAGAYDHDEEVFSPGAEPERDGYYILPIVDLGMVRGRFRNGCWLSHPSEVDKLFCASVAIAF